jgi:uncharacterized protein (DUF1330 family)
MQIPEARRLIGGAFVVAAVPQFRGGESGGPWRAPAPLDRTVLCIAARQRVRMPRLPRSHYMAAYLIANIEVADAAAYEEYRRLVPAVIAAHGGRYLARGGATERLEGTLAPKRMVLLEFPDMARLKGFYHSPEYQRIIALRQRASEGSLIAIEGL